MNLPKYKDGSIVNLMSSIIRSMDGKSNYGELSDLKARDLAKSKNIVLVAIDSLGYEYINNHGQDSAMYEYLKGKMTTVFPSTTISAVTTFATGDAPNAHGLTAWTMFSKEIGAMIEPINFTLKSGKVPLDKYGISIDNLFNQKTTYEKIKAYSYILMYKDFVDSQYSSAVSHGAKMLAAKSLSDLFGKTAKILRKKGGRKYVYTYWHYFDNVCHQYGHRSLEAKKHFEEIDKTVEKFLKSIKGTDTTVIITGDHGQIHSEDSHFITLSDRKEIYDDLLLPLCGEPRMAYCYVKHGRHREFERKIKKELGKYCDIHKSSEFLKKGYFGPGKSNEKTKERIGDYILVMKDNFYIRDKIIGRELKFRPGNHGGVSAEEMFVPLIVAKK